MKQALIFICMATLFSCKEQTTVGSDRQVVAGVVNETDPFCHMSLKEHVSDTALIDGRIWAFCSPLCKERYMQLK